MKAVDNNKMKTFYLRHFIVPKNFYNSFSGTQMLNPECPFLCISLFKHLFIDLLQTDHTACSQKQQLSSVTGFLNICLFCMFLFFVIFAAM